MADVIDTREKLEADVHQYANPSSCKNTLGSCWEKKMLSFLDRQAAITEREIKERVDFSLITQTANALFPDYQERIAELTAERDQLSRDLDAEHALVVQFEHDNEELKAERDKLQKVVQIQADSFQKLERELKEAFDGKAE